MEYHVGDLVQANAGVGRFVGTIVDITEHPRREPLYEVRYEGGLGHGSHTASELIHLASEDYPEMGDILYERPDPVRHVAALHTASDEDWQHSLFGCHHTSLGRVLSHHLAAVPGTPEWEHAWHAVPDLAEHVNGAREGATDYAESHGLQPSRADYSHLMADKDRHARIAKAYLEAQHHDPTALRSFHAMRNEIHEQFHHLTHNMGVDVQFKHHDPYRDHHDLARDLNQHGRLQVLKTEETGGHPVFSNEENDKFRAVHDFFGHAATRRGFDRNGEEAAWHHHAHMFTPEARAALTTETRGQNAALIHTGEFQPQKIALLPHEFHSDEAVRSVKHGAKAQQPHDIIEHGGFMHTRDETHEATRFYRQEGTAFSGWIVRGPGSYSDPIPTKPEAKHDLKALWHHNNENGGVGDRNRICPRCNSKEEIHAWLTERHPSHSTFKLGGELGSTSVDTGDSVQRTTDVGAIHNVDVATYPKGTLCAMCNLQPVAAEINHTPVCKFCAEARFGVDMGGVEHLFGQTTASLIMEADDDDRESGVLAPEEEEEEKPERKILYPEDWPAGGGHSVWDMPERAYRMRYRHHFHANAKVKRIPKVLSDDLRRPEYQGEPGTTGHCYVASEAAYHLLGGKDAGWTPHHINHEGQSHWFLKHNSGKVLDLTADQFKTPVPYEYGTAKGFLTKGPSKRAQEVIRRVGGYDNVEHVPLHELKRLREYDRSAPGMANTDLDALTEDIRQNGVQSPLIIQYGKNDRRAKIGEGNHRLVAAERLGMTHLPARVWRVSEVPDGHPVPGHKEEFDQYGHARHVNADLRPSEIGLSGVKDPPGQGNLGKIGLWQDVQAKAARLRSDGKVKLLELPTADNPYLFGEVEGDHGFYHPIIHREGNKKLAFLCECVWGDYSENGPLADRRAPESPYRTRMCAHALSLIYELQSRSMFGREPHLGSIWSHIPHEVGTHQVPLEQAREWIDPGMRDREKLKAFDGHGYWDNLKNSMATEGQREPIVVKHTPNGPVIWEGNHRTHVADELGWSHIDAKFAAHDSPGDPIEELEDAVETDPEVHLDKAGKPHTGVMVALVLPEDIAKEVAVPGGEIPQDLHVTIGFLGKSDDIDPSALHQAVLNFCRTAPGVITGKISGFGDFKVDSSYNDGFEHVHIGLVSIPGFDRIRQDLVRSLADHGLEMSERFGPQPHISIMYSHEPLEYDTMPPVLDKEITWPAVTVAHGGIWRHYPLSLSKTAAADSCPECGAEKPFHNFGCEEDRAPRKYWGKNDLHELFGSGSHAVAPFKSSGQAKSYDKDLVSETLKRDPEPHEIVHFDPRELHGTQPGLQRPAMEYYMGKEYDESGKTYADQHNAGNKLPVVYTYNHPVTGREEHMILSGHHRATRALLRGEMMRGRQIRGPVVPRR